MSSANRLSVVTRRLRRRPDAVFVSGFVVPAFRSRHLFQAIYDASAAHAARGSMHLWSWCEAWNQASHRSTARRTVLGVRGALRA